MSKSKTYFGNFRWFYGPVTNEKTLLEVKEDEAELARVEGWVRTCTGKWPKHRIFRKDGKVRIEFQISQRDAERLRGKESPRELLEKKRDCMKRMVV